MKPPKLVFSYREQVTENPVAGTEETHAYPFLPCTFEWEGKRTPQTEGLLDSGSDGLVLPLGIARYLGLTLKEEEKPMRVVAREYHDILRP